MVKSVLTESSLPEEVEDTSFILSLQLTEAGRRFKMVEKYRRDRSRVYFVLFPFFKIAD